jgi:hypothetical protein
MRIKIKQKSKKKKKIPGFGANFALERLLVHGLVHGLDSVNLGVAFRNKKKKKESVQRERHGKNR